MGKDDATRVKDLSSDELKALIQEAVEQALLELLGDPDQGLVVREAVRERLKDSLERTRRGEHGMPAQDAARRAGLTLPSSST